MLELHERYLTDTEGRRVAVVLDLPVFERLLAEYERWAAQGNGTTEEESGTPDPAVIAEALSIIGLAQSEPPLIDGKPVSEFPDLYLYGEGAQS